MTGIERRRGLRDGERQRDKSEMVTLYEKEQGERDVDFDERVCVLKRQKVAICTALYTLHCGTMHSG